jgi:hypothetical protein
MDFLVFAFAIVAWAIELLLLIWFVRQIMTSTGQKAIRATLLVAMVIGSAWFSYRKVDNIRESYQQTQLQNIWIGGEDIAHKNACEQMIKQTEQFQGWSVLILGGIVAILVTTKVHRIAHFGWAYLPLGPAAVFLTGSLNVGWVFSKRYAYIVAKNNFELPKLSSLLEVQSDLFLYSIICVSLFAACFLFFIVLERVEPFEEKKES